MLPSSTFVVLLNDLFQVYVNFLLYTDRFNGRTKPAIFRFSMCKVLS